MISPTQIASANGTQTRPTSFKASATALESVQVLALQYDQTKTLIEENTLYLLTTPQKTGEKFGFNTEIYYAHYMQYQITGGQVKTYALPIAEPANAAASTGTFTFSGTITESGTYEFYIHGVKLSIAVVTTDTATTLGDKFVTAVNGSDLAMFTASNAVGVVTLTSTVKSLSSADLKFSGPLTRKNDADVPEGLTVAIVQPTGGAGDEVTVLDDAWEAIVAYNEWITDVVTPSNLATSLTLATSYIGMPDDGTGQGSNLWADTNYRPCTNWIGIEDDLSTSLAVSANFTDDPNNVVVVAPDYLEPSFILATCASAYVAKSANTNPATKYQNASVPLVGPTSLDNDWTNGSAGATSVNTAVKGGLTPVVLDDNSNPVLWDVTTTARPAGWSNYPLQFEVNKRKTWNAALTVKNDKLVFINDVIVESVEEASSQVKATDEDTEKARIVSLVEYWVKFGWVYNGTFTTNNMVVARSKTNPDRIDRVIPILLSGNKRVMSDTILVDRNLNIADEAITVKIG